MYLYTPAAMSYLVSVNSNNISSNDNSNFKYSLPSVVDLSDYEVCVAGITMYNSQFNVDNSRYYNNSFSIEVPTGTTTSVINVTLPDGYYSYADINRYIQRKLVEAGSYLIDSDSNNVFYIQISENSAYYSCQLDVSSTPTSLPSGYTRPATGLYSAGGSGLPTTGRVPRLIINNAEFGKLLGFNTGTYPASLTTTASAILSNITPQVNPVSSYVLRCSLVNNLFSNPPDVLCSFDSSGTTIGQLISYRPNEFIWQKVSAQYVNEIYLQITDQEYKSVAFKDPNVLIQLLFREAGQKK